MTAEMIAGCAAQVERADIDRFKSAMTAPMPGRADLMVLYAFNLEVSRAPWVTQEPMIAEMRLQWWRDVVEEIAAGKPPRAHEVATPLAELVTRATLSCDDLDAMITARRWDIYKDAFEDAAHFQEYLSKTGGHLMWASVKALGGDPSAESAVRDFGYAFALSRWFCAVPNLETAGRIPLVDGRSEAVQEQAQNALNMIKPVHGLGKARAAVRAGWQTRVILNQVVRDPHAVADGRLGQGDFAKSWGLFKHTLLQRGI